MRDLADELLQAKVKARLFGGDHAPRLGRLVILDRIGAGAMGTVYAAYDPRLDRKVAVKILHAADGDANARFLREARALGKLAHPNVVAIHDAGEQDGAVHIVMELAVGVPLRAWINHPDHDWRDVVRVMREVAAGLAAAHRAGVVHRDIKPDNILIGDDRARVVDFGLANDSSGSDSSFLPGAGTPSYMAPEVLAGKPATPASDQFSFAVTLFEALHGERPHTGTTRGELREAALHASKASTRRPRPAPSTRGRRAIEKADTQPLAEGRSSDDRTASSDPRTASSDSRTVSSERRTARPTSLPSWVSAIVKRALAADPAERFPAMEAIVAELGRDRRRKRWVLAVGAALVLGGVGGVAAYRMQANEPIAVSCDGTARRAAIWSDRAAERVRSELGDAPWGVKALTSLGEVATQWETSFRTVCEATRIRGEQSDRLLELRMRCLDRALARFGALVEALSIPLAPSNRVEAAVATAQLPRPGACEVLTDATELALPSDPATRAEITAVEHELDGAWASYVLARYGEARTQVTAIEARTAKLDAPPLRAATLLLAGSIEARTGDSTKARALLDQALVASAKARAPELELAVWSRLLRQELFAGEPARVIEWSAFAMAAAARAGRDGAELDGIVAEAMRDTGQLTAARERLRTALASRDPLREDQRAFIEMNLGSIELESGKSGLAEAAFQRAFDSARNGLGNGHPTLGIFLDKRADVARARGRIGEALALHEQSLAIRRGAFGEHDRAVATALYHRAETLLEAGRLDRASRDLEVARAIRASSFSARSPRLGELDVLLGDLAFARGEPDTARTLYDRAAALDPRLELSAHRLALPTRPPLDPVQLAREAAVIAPFSVERVAAIAARIAVLPRDRAAPLAAALLVRWRGAGAVDAALSLPVADALRAAGDRASAAAVYTAALTALADEPSRSRLRAFRGLAATLDGAAAGVAASAARTIAASMPELAGR